MKERSGRYNFKLETLPLNSALVLHTLCSPVFCISISFKSLYAFMLCPRIGMISSIAHPNFSIHTHINNPVWFNYRYPNMTHWYISNHYVLSGSHNNTATHMLRYTIWMTKIPSDQKKSSQLPSCSLLSGDGNSSISIRPSQGVNSKALQHPVRYQYITKMSFSKGLL